MTQHNFKVTRISRIDKDGKPEGISRINLLIDGKESHRQIEVPREKETQHMVEIETQLRMDEVALQAYLALRPDPSKHDPSELLTMAANSYHVAAAFLTAKEDFNPDTI